MAECIESVLSQTFTDWEFVISDNCSSDRTRSIAEAYAAKDKRIKVYSFSDLVPVTASFNRAASLVSPQSQYLKFVCADDTLFPECLRLMVEVAASNPQIKLVGSYKIHGNEAVSDGPPYPQQQVPGREVCKWFFQGKLGILGSETNHLIRVPSDEATRRKLFDEDYFHADTEYFVRLLAEGGDFGFVHQVLTVTRVHGEAISNYTNRMGTGTLEYLNILTKYGPLFLSEAELKAAIRVYRRKHARLLVVAFMNAWNRSVWREQVRSSKRLNVPLRLLDILMAGFREAAAVVSAPIASVGRLKREISRAKV